MNGCVAATSNTWSSHAEALPIRVIICVVTSVAQRSVDEDKLGNVPSSNYTGSSKASTPIRSHLSARESQVLEGILHFVTPVAFNNNKNVTSGPVCCIVVTATDAAVPRKFAERLPFCSFSAHSWYSSQQKLPKYAIQALLYRVCFARGIPVCNRLHMISPH